MADGLITRGLSEAAPVIVHVQSMRLMMPGGAELGETQVAYILAELAKVRMHYEFARLSVGAPADIDPPEIAG